MIEEYIVTGPIWLITPRNVADESFAVMFNRHDGHEYLMAFTDSDLAMRYLTSDQRCANCRFSVVDTKQQFLELLQFLQDEGIGYIGFDTWPGGSPAKLLTIAETMAALQWSINTEHNNGNHG